MCFRQGYVIDIPIMNFRSNCMKGLHALFIIAIAMVVFALPSCGDAPTELGWENGESSETINDIIWADGDKIWSTAGGYSPGVRTVTKEVKELNGMVECKYDTTGFDDFATALVY